MDMTESIAPKSDQLNAEDLLSGPRTFTVAEVRKGSVEQPVDVHLVEFPGRPFKPSKTVRRIMVAAWGVDSATYAGHRMTLYRDPAVRFGGQDVGGIRVSHMSGLEKRLTIALTVTRGKRAPYVVEPIAGAPADVITPSSPGSITAPQITKLQTMYGKVGITERDDKLAYAVRIIDRPLESAKDLSLNEAVQIIDALGRVAGEPVDAEAEPDPTLDAGFGGRP